MLQKYWENFVGVNKGEVVELESEGDTPICCKELTEKVEDLGHTSQYFCKYCSNFYMGPL
ncbi:hypothetical protein [Paenibacillus sp. NPDC057934]|uniref:hypothetical protein n=1 Tax=Paenibacillus sp. NPDC057934 TaxID=3346282 RepID=UPI0036DBE0A0